TPRRRSAGFCSTARHLGQPWAGPSTFGPSHHRRRAPGDCKVYPQHPGTADRVRPTLSRGRAQLLPGSRYAAQRSTGPRMCSCAPGAPPLLPPFPPKKILELGQRHPGRSTCCPTRPLESWILPIFSVTSLTLQHDRKKLSSMAHILEPPEGPTDGPEASTSSVPTTVLRIRSLLPSLAPAERRVAQRVVDVPERAAASSITQLAKDCATSEATVIRFCRTIDFSGYRELRLALATEVGQVRGARSSSVEELSSDINPDDTLASVVQKIAYTDARAVEETGAALDVEELRAVIGAMVGARRVDVYGVGASAFVGADLQQKLHRIGLTSFSWSDAHVMLTSAALLEETD